MDVRRAPLPRTPPEWLLAAALAGAYFAGARFGISLPVAKGVITPVWAPSGIAVVALFLLGGRFWPAIALGAFSANLDSGAGAAVAAGIAVGNTLEAVVGAGLLRRFDFSARLARIRDVLALVLLSAAASTAIAATNGVAVLRADNQLHGSIGSSWTLWWFGDAAGILMVAPFLFVAIGYLRGRRRPTRARLLEAAVVLAVLTGTSLVLFVAGGWRYPYLIFPVLVYAVLRFHQLGAAASTLLVGAIGTLGAANGTVPISTANPTERVQVIQALIAITAITLLLLAATLAEREAAGDELRQASERLAEAQALTHIGSWSWEIGRREVAWSDELYRILGLTPRSGPGSYERFLRAVHPDDRPFVGESIAAAIENREGFQLEHRIVLPDGRDRFVQGRGRVVVGQDGTERMVGTVQDVTAERQIETLRDDILSTVSHELRTPLTSVLGAATTLHARSDTLPPSTSRVLLEQLVQQAQRLERLLVDLLDIDRLRHGLVGTSRRPTDIAELVERVAAAHAEPASSFRFSLEPLVANVDAPKLERVVDNLLANAVRHGGPGAPITVRLFSDGGDLLLSVEDQGPGVPDELKLGIFEIFNRGEKAMSSERGTGIGLSLVARYVALHEGRVWVENTESGGAAFRVFLPACVAPSTEPAAVD
jgi:signal transduction histidine kinase